MYRKFIASSLPLLVAACAGPQKPAPTVNVPDKLKPGASESLAMIVPAKGVQIYECRAKKIKPAPTNGHSLRPRPISSMRAEGRRLEALCRSALGIGRRQQDRGYSEGKYRCATGRRHTLVATGYKVCWPARFVQQNHEHPTRKHRRRCRTEKVCSQAVVGTPARINHGRITISSPRGNWVKLADGLIEYAKLGSEGCTGPFAGGLAPQRAPTLSRQDKLGASCRAKVQAGEELATRPYRVLHLQQSQVQELGRPHDSSADSQGSV